NSYRPPALLAKMSATIDVISGGRLDFGIGGGWYEHEYQAYGYPYPPVGERLRQLEEAVQLITAMWTQERASFRGRYYTVDGAVCEPKPLQRPHPPIWIGGGGEQKTLRVVAEHAGGWNAFPLPIPQLQHKLDALRGHCDAVGRDYDAIRKQLVCTAIVRADSAQ